MIGEFFGPARLVAGSGLAVVTATVPCNRNFVAVTQVGLGLARSSSRASRRAGALPQFFAKLERLKDGLK